MSDLPTLPATGATVQPHACQVCGAPGVFYQKHGQQHQRYYCNTHWNAYITGKRHEQRRKDGIPDGWKIIRDHWLKPSPGMTRVCIDNHRHRITVYHGNALKTVKFRDLRRLNTFLKLVDYYQAIGYRPVRQSKRWMMLEKVS